MKTKKTYSELLRDPRWQKKRLEIMNRDQFTCVKCGTKEHTLHIHHLKYTGQPWQAPDKDLETVCEDCHFIIEDTKREGYKTIKVEREHYDGYGYLFNAFTDNAIFFYDRDKYLIKAIHRKFVERSYKFFQEQ